jgi:hypothetical protein
MEVPERCPAAGIWVTSPRNGRLRETEAEEVQQLVVVQLGEPPFPARSDDFLGQTSFFFQHGVDVFFNGALRDECVHHDIFLLANTEGSIGGLVFHRRIPPTIKVHDVIRCGQVQTDAASFERQHQKGNVGVPLLEGVDEGLALFHRHATVQDKTGPPEDASQEVVQSRGDFPELRKYERLSHVLTTW